MNWLFICIDNVTCTAYQSVESDWLKPQQTSPAPSLVCFQDRKIEGRCFKLTPTTCSVSSVTDLLCQQELETIKIPPSGVASYHGLPLPNEALGYSTISSSCGERNVPLEISKSPNYASNSLNFLLNSVECSTNQLPAAILVPFDCQFPDSCCYRPTPYLNAVTRPLPILML